jgi:hypothetical protein
MTTTQAWYRIESSRRDPPWANVMRSGASLSLMDELHAAREELAEPLLRLRTEWLDDVPDGVGSPRWRDEMHDPVLVATAIDFQIQAPDTWGPIEARLLDDEQYRDARTKVDDVQRLLDRTRDLEGAAAGRAPVPDDIGLLLMGGNLDLDPYVELLGTTSAVPIVDSRFEGALVDAGLTTGWTTTEIEVRGPNTERIATHRLLVVTARVSDEPAVIEAHGVARAAENAPVARALRRPHGRTRAVHMSSAAVDALTNAGLPGLAFSASDMTAINP